jgi:hypothetical protein
MHAMTPVFLSLALGGATVLRELIPLSPKRDGRPGQRPS